MCTRSVKGSISVAHRVVRQFRYSTFLYKPIILFPPTRKMTQPFTTPDTLGLVPIDTSRTLTSIVVFRFGSSPLRTTVPSSRTYFDLSYSLTTEPKNYSEERTESDKFNQKNIRSEDFVHVG